MNYKEYSETANRIKARQDALNRQFLEEYAHKELIGKLVNVRYRFKGSMHTERLFFDGIHPCYFRLEPVFRYPRPDGRPSKTIVGQIYSLRQIETITEVNGKSNKRNPRNESSAKDVRKAQGLVAAASQEDSGTESRQND